ncbi:hypothetical protein ES705_19114 [subsurface metagenome]
MNTREEIIDLLSKNKKPLGPKKIAFELKKTSANIRKILSNLCREEKVERVVYGKYISLEISEQWRKDNPEYKNQYQKDNREEAKERSKQYYKNNREKIKKCSKQWRKNNPEREEKYGKQWRKNNRDKRNIDNRERYKTDLKYNLNVKISRAIKRYSKGNKNGRHWEGLVGYNSNDLIKRLNETMPVGYTWQDYLNGDLHTDHIIPISAFNFTRPEHTDFKRCWALENLRLLPAQENLIKNAKLDRPFQLALKI